MKFASSLLGLSLVAVAACARKQLPMMPPVSPVYDAGLFTPVESLSALSTSEYTTLSHPFFPGVSARIKKTEFCDPTVSSYTGYIDVSEAKHLFFYFFESRSDPDKDDVIFWTNGGPGCSSAMGLFMELGPCRVANSTTTTYHPESWNSNANVFFIDQPVNVGFSYSEYGEHVDTTEEAAEDIAAFIVLFFENFPAFKGRALHMAGESYGGRYIPLFSAAIYDQNAALVEAGITPINLTSAIIGNGYTDQLGMMLSYYDVTCTPASLPPVISISSCVRMKKALPRCEKALKTYCADSYDSMNCEAAWHFCSSEIIAPFDDTGINAYDLSKQCAGAVKDTLCYPETKVIASYLDNPKTRAILGIDSSRPKNFSSCDWTVNTAFASSGDTVQTSYTYVSALLERGVSVLVYVGDYDWICNWVGSERWTLALEWSGQKEFRSQALREWTVDGEAAGVTRKAGRLTFATVKGAGHMVPFDKPKQSLALINRWLAKEDL